MKRRITSGTTPSAGIAVTLLLAVMTAASGVAHRVGNGGDSPATWERMGAKLNEFPHDIGDWPLRETSALNEVVLRELRSFGYVNREYFSPRSQREAHLLLLLGPAGTMVTHTPEVCFGTRDFEVLGAPSRVECQDAAGRTHQFWLTRVGRRDASAEVLRVYHAWADDGVWRASEFPRWDFTFAPMLAKCQVAFLESDVPDAAAEELAFLSELTTVTSQSCEWPGPQG